MKKNIFLSFVSLFALNTHAKEIDLPSVCLVSMASVLSSKLPVEVIDPAGVGKYKWKLTWDGKSIFRESYANFLGMQIGTSKQEIWNLNKQLESGDGNTGVAPTLQVMNAKKYFISKALFYAGKEYITPGNALKIDKSLADCEGVSTKVALDGEPISKEKWVDAGDLARDLRSKVRAAQPGLFMGKFKMAPAATR